MKSAIISVTILVLLGLGFSENTAFAVNFPTVNFIYSPSKQINTPALFSNGFGINAVPVNDFTFSSIATSTLVMPQFKGSSTTNDIVYSLYKSASVDNFCASSLTNTLLTPAYTSVTPSIGTIDQSGNVTYVSSGTAQFNATILGRTRAILCDFSQASNATTSTFASFAPGSLANELLVEGTTTLGIKVAGSNTQNVYSAANDTTHTYTRNPSLFISDGQPYSVDITAIPAYNSQSGSAFEGILITPDIMMFANHVALANGTVLYFVTSTSTTLTRTVIGGQFIASSSDLYIARLSSPFLPGSGVTPAETFSSTTFQIYNAPTNFLSEPNKLTWAAQNTRLLPFFYTRQDREIHASTAAAFFSGAYITAPSLTSVFYPWYSPIIGGDSGSPAFTILNGHIVALSAWHNPNAGDSYYYYETQVNAAIQALGSIYRLTPVDLSSFSTF